MSYIVIIQDIDGLPRAWGHASTKVLAEREAERQWKLRLAKKKAEGTTDRSEERGLTTVKKTRADGRVSSGARDE